MSVIEILTDKLPKGWKLQPLKAVSEYIVSNVDKIINEDEIEVQLCNYTDVYKNDFITDDMEFMKGSATVDEIDKFNLKVGDVIITKDSESWDDIAIPALVKSSNDNIVCGYHLAILRPDKSKLNSDYLFRCLQSKDIRIQLELAATGVTRYGLPKDAIGRLFLPIPEYKKQADIAFYLDSETAYIDNLIKQKETLLELLAKKRQAIITHAVTKGINPNAKMKDSGIDWLGEIPEHWDVKQLKYACDYIKTGGTPSPDWINYESENKINWYTPADFSESIELTESKRKLSVEAIENEGYNLFDEGTVLVVGIGATLGKVSLATCSCYSNQQINALAPNNRTYPRYLAFLLRGLTDLLKVEANTATLPILNQQRMGAINIVLPPLSEQKEISEYISKYTNRIENIIKANETSIELLKERRATLITAAVTGQIEIN